MKTMWLIKQAAEPKSLDIYIYDDIAADGFDWWSGEKIESETSASYIKNVLNQAGDAETINIYINSYGGDCKEGLGIYNQLKRHPAQKIVHVDGFACSVASVIAMAGDKVIMGSNTLMMIHHAWTWACGNPSELRKSADDLEVIDNASCSSYLAKAGDKITQEKLTELLDAATWLTAEQCIEYGLADEIQGKIPKDIETANQRFQQAKQFEIERHMKALNPAAKVPKEFQQQKTNAEKLMVAFGYKRNGGK